MRESTLADYIGGVIRHRVLYVAIDWDIRRVSLDIWSESTRTQTQLLQQLD